MFKLGLLDIIEQFTGWRQNINDRIISELNPPHTSEHRMQHKADGEQHTQGTPRIIGYVQEMYIRTWKYHKIFSADFGLQTSFCGILSCDILSVPFRMNVSKDFCKKYMLCNNAYDVHEKVECKAFVNVSNFAVYLYETICYSNLVFTY